MYQVSDAFHEAVKNGNRQIPLLIFPDRVFTADDINISRGISFHDRFNSEENIRIGQTMSNDVSFSLFNDSGLLNDYEFGDFLATIGVYLQSDTFPTAGNCYMRTLYSMYVGYSVSPYLTRGGTAVSSPPGWPVLSMLCYDGKVYVFGASGNYKVYRDSDGADITSSNPVNSFMLAKAGTWSMKGWYYNESSRILFCYDNVTGKRDMYEFCPLGWFTAERPNAPDVILISMTCHDFMQKLDVDMPSASALGISYPATIGTLFQKICNYVGLPYRTTTFINSTATIDTEPEDFADCTIRTVLGWIAEAAGANARIDRDGYVILDWLKSSGQTFDENNYSKFEPYWYQTRKVTKLYNRDTVEASDSTVGSGSENYLIQDNPLLRGAT